uniref:Golgi SNAP receptor complex member 1 n=1 Tax=Lepeophtheirus salmonis TaxID=72036 RepID=D3PIH1_LEPSM|nr:Golgi SNAP receptor complex member 1 [Lepeophtheirus salmonis]
MSSKGRVGAEVRWEDLRKEARRLENEIDSKLVTLSKTGSEFGAESYYSQDRLLSANEDNSSITNKIQDLESSLDRLSSINDLLSESTSSSGSTGRHILQRHREILSDYQQEFRKTKAHIESIIQRQDLLSSNSSNIYHKPNEEMESLLMENESVRNSERLLDEQINIALDSRETLISQRQAFKAMRKKLNDISNRFPVINNLVHKINLRKKKDAVILGSVIGFCLLFFLWYMFG